MANIIIRETNNYGLFELLPFNREVKQTKWLEKSMLKYGFLSTKPLHVVKNGNGKLLIKDGHHRFYVARKLKIPVKYVIATEHEQISIYEMQKTTKGWTPHDYLTAHTREGKNPAYTTIKEYHEKTGIPIGRCIAMLAGQSAGSASNKMNVFTSGQYKLGDQTHAAIVGDIVLHLKKLGVSWASNSLFVQAISKTLFVDEFNPSQFKEKLSTHLSLIEKKASLNDYMQMIDLIYNRQSKTKIPLKFLAEETARIRSKTFGRCK